MNKKIIATLLTSVALLTTASAAYAEVESNDQPILSDYFYDSISGEINSFNDVDWFRTTNGGTLYLDHASFFGNTAMRIYDADQNFITYCNTSGDEQITLPYGTYYIQVTGDSGKYVLDWR